MRGVLVHPLTASLSDCQFKRLNNRSFLLYDVHLPNGQPRLAGAKNIRKRLDCQSSLRLTAGRAIYIPNKIVSATALPDGAFAQGSRLHRTGVALTADCLRRLIVVMP